MKRIPQTNPDEKALFETLNFFFDNFVSKAGIMTMFCKKVKGISVMHILRKLFELVFVHMTSHMAICLNQAGMGFSRSTLSRFLTSPRNNWLCFMTRIAKKITDYFIPLTDERRRLAFVIDDTPFHRSYSKRVELLTNCYDHSEREYYWGFRLMTLGWSDGNSFVPVNSCLLTSQDTANIRMSARKTDKRTNGYKARQMAQEGGFKASLSLLDQAMREGIRAGYVLFDSWFSLPCMIKDIRERNLHIVAMVKDTSKVYYRHKGRHLSTQELYKASLKRRGRSRYLLSTTVTLTDNEGWECQARLVFVRDRKNRKKYRVLLSTDMTLTEDEIIQLYARRWSIEEFFKVSKDLLRLEKDCISQNFDTIRGYIAIVFIRAMFLSVISRMEHDDRTVGILFYSLCEEMREIEVREALGLMFRLFAPMAAKELNVDQQRVDDVIGKFLAGLPPFIVHNLAQVA